LHLHTTESDGKDDIRAMAAAARDAGLEYIAITDHSQSLAMANGLDERRALAHAARIRAMDAEGVGVRLLAGIECDIRPDGSLDLADDCLASLDLVVASDVFYYWQLPDLEASLRRIESAIAPGGRLVAAHYRPPMGAILDGDEVHDALSACLDLRHVHSEAVVLGQDPYRFDVYERATGAGSEAA